MRDTVNSRILESWENFVALFILLMQTVASLLHSAHKQSQSVIQNGFAELKLRFVLPEA